MKKESSSASIPFRQALTEVKDGDPRCGSETVWVGFAPPPSDAPPPPRNGLEEVFIHLWSRLTEAHFSASICADQCKKGHYELLQKNLGNVIHHTDVDAIFGQMQRTLAEVEDGNRIREEDLRRQIGNLWKINWQLQAKLKAAKKLEVDTRDGENRP